MALNFADRLAVRANIIGRCTGAVANYALYLLGLEAATEAQKAWAANAIRNPAATGEQVSWYILNQPDFINDGSGLSDASLSASVEAAINNHFIDG